MERGSLRLVIAGVVLIIFIAFGAASVVFKQVIYGESPFNGNVVRTVKILEASNANVIVLNTGNAEISTGSVLVYSGNIKAVCEWNRQLMQPGESAVCRLFAPCVSGSQVKVAGPENIDALPCR